MMRLRGDIEFARLTPLQRVISRRELGFWRLLWQWPSWELINCNLNVYKEWTSYLYINWCSSLKCQFFLFCRLDGATSNAWDSPLFLVLPQAAKMRTFPLIFHPLSFILPSPFLSAIIPRDKRAHSRSVHLGTHHLSILLYPHRLLSTYCSWIYLQCSTLLSSSDRLCLV